MQYEMQVLFQSLNLSQLYVQLSVNIIKNEAPITTSEETISTLLSVNKVTLNFYFLSNI